MAVYCARFDDGHFVLMTCTLDFKAASPLYTMWFYWLLRRRREMRSLTEGFKKKKMDE